MGPFGVATQKGIPKMLSIRVHKFTRRTSTLKCLRVRERTFFVQRLCLDWVQNWGISRLMSIITLVKMRGQNPDRPLSFVSAINVFATTEIFIALFSNFRQECKLSRSAPRTLSCWGSCIYWGISRLWWIARKLTHVRASVCLLLGSEIVSLVLRQLL